jgi:hypothetical protein
VQATPDAQELCPLHVTVQSVPAQATGPAHELMPSQSIEQLLAAVQSTPPAQPLRPHVT